MKKILTGLALASLLVAVAGCGVNPEQGKRTLEAQGLSNIVIGGYPLFGCGRDDEFASKFTATGVNGQPVSGVLCGGWLKGMTVRFD